MNKDKSFEPVQIYAGTSLYAGMLQSLFVDAGIESFLKDDLMGTINPWVTEAGGVGAVKVLVSKNNAEKAILIVKEFEENLRESDIS